MFLHSPSPGLPDLVDRMSPNKVSKLIELLAEKKDYQNELKTLYSPEESEHVEFASFLEEHSISFLGGGNSSNYQV